MKKKAVKKKKKEIKPTSKKKKAVDDFNEDEAERRYEEKMEKKAKEGSKKKTSRSIGINLEGLNVDWFKPEVDKIYRIDIIPFVISQEWYSDLRQYISGNPTRKEVGDFEGCLEIPLHKGLGVDNNKSALCLKEAFSKLCPVCEYKKKKREEDADKHKDLIKDLNVSWRTIYNVIDRGGDRKKILLWEISWHNFQKAIQSALEISEEGCSTYSSMRNGKCLVFKVIQGSYSKTLYPMVDYVTFKERKHKYKSSEERANLRETVYKLDELLMIPTYEEVQALFLEEGDKKEEVEETDFPGEEEEEGSEEEEEGSEEEGSEEEEDELEEGGEYEEEEEGGEYEEDKD